MGRTVYSLQRMPASLGMQAVMLGSSQLAWGQLPTKSLWDGVNVQEGVSALSPEVFKSD